MKLALSICTLALVACAPFAEPAAATPTPVAKCTSTGWTIPGSGLTTPETALLINPSGTVSGDVDATGCDIGIYYSTKTTKGSLVSNANVHSAYHFGIVNNGANVTVRSSNISDIHPTPFDGESYYGFAIYWVAGSAAQGAISNNAIWDYQKDGIAVRGPNATATIQGNAVFGLGPQSFTVAQNGIELGLGADNVQIEQNLVFGNSYTGPNGASGGGIVVYGGACFGGAETINTLVKGNTFFGNDVGVYLLNLNGSCNSSTTPTKNIVTGNVLINNALNNTTGWNTSPPQGYQAGIMEGGDGDTLEGNVICGLGYKAPGTKAVLVYAIDTTSYPPIGLTQKDNSICSSTSAGVMANAPFVGRWPGLGFGGE